MGRVQDTTPPTSSRVIAGGARGSTMPKFPDQGAIWIWSMDDVHTRRPARYPQRVQTPPHLAHGLSGSLSSSPLGAGASAPGASQDSLGDPLLE